MKLLIPKKLKKGDTIGVISPSFGGAKIFPHRVQNAINFLEQEGFKVKMLKNSENSIGYISDYAEKRANDINEAFSDPGISAIICSIGGNHSNQILKYLNYELIKNNPKIFIGYSDISVLHYALLIKSNLQTYYGPCLMTQFGEFPAPLEYTYDYFKKIVIDVYDKVNIVASETWTSEILNWVTKDDMLRSRIMNISEGYEWLREGAAQGQIIGGCIPSINHLLGTEYWIDPTNKIFFIDIPEGHVFGEGLSISELDSYLADLDNVGLFGSIKGLIVGRPYNYNEEQIENLKEILLKYTKGSAYPILLNANIGHVDPIITLPLFSRVCINSSKNEFSISN